MKYTWILVSAIFLFGCNLQKKKETSQKTALPQIEEVTNDLIGKITRSNLEVLPYAAWFTENYNNYNLDKQTIASFEEVLSDYEITIFMGTWCGDSKREVPVFYKILDETEFDPQKITLIAVSEYKDTPEGFQKGRNITHVPTFIFEKNGVESNRIVESPIATLEMDIYSILTNKEYQHTYSKF